MDKRKKRRRLLLLLALLVAAVLWIRALNHMELTVTRYRIPTEKLSEDFRIALLSDLHSQEFGPGNSSLIREIRAYEPDLILVDESGHETREYKTLYHRED